MLFRLLPLLSGLVEKVIAKLWPDRSEVRSRQHQIDMEEMRKYGYPPKVILKYAIVFLFLAVALWALLSGLFAAIPSPPETALRLLEVADSLFGLGG